MEDRKDGTEDTAHGSNLGEKKFVCPVCGKLLHEKNLPDMESVIYDNLYYRGGVRIASPKVQLYCYFDHRYDEERFTIENPHSLVGVVDAEFDQGECTGFVIAKIRPAEDSKSQNPTERR